MTPQTNWLATMIVDSGHLSVEYIRELTDAEDDDVAATDELLRAVTVGSPHAQLVRHYRAIQTAYSAEDLATESGRTAAEERVQLAVKNFVSLGQALGTQIEHMLTALSVTMAPALVAVLVSESTHVREELVPQLATCIEPGHLALALGIAGPLPPPEAEPALDSVLGQVMRSSEVMHAHLLLVLKERIDEGCRAVKSLDAEILVGDGVLLPQMKPSAEGGIKLERHLPTSRVTEAQLLLRQAKALVEAEDDRTSGTQTTSTSQSADGVARLATAPIRSEEHTPADPETNTETHDTAELEPPARPPTIPISDLALHVRDEALGTLSTWSAAIDDEALSTNRDRLKVAAVAVGAELARAAETSDLAVIGDVDDLNTADHSDPQVIARFDATGSVIALKLLLRSIDAIAEPVGLKFAGQELLEIQWNPEAIAKTMSVAQWVANSADSRHTSESSLLRARHCLEWGMPAAALTYIAHHLRKTANDDSELVEATRKVDGLLTDYQHGHVPAPGLLTTYAALLIELASSRWWTTHKRGSGS